MFELTQFAKIAEAGHRIDVGDNGEGVPVLQVAQDGFKGKVLAALSHVPLLKNLQVVKEYTEQVRASNARTLGVFIHALSARFGDDVAERAMQKSKLDLSGNTPLGSRTIQQIVTTAERLKTWGPAPAQLCGFQNLGNTCYLNSSLKFLMHSVGEERLTKHLEHVKNTATDPVQRDVAEKFIGLVKASHKSAEPLESELAAFMASAQKLEPFNKVGSDGKHLFQIRGVQNDAQEFMLKLAASFDFEKIQGCSVSLQETFVNGTEQRSKQASPTYCGDVSCFDPKASLQAILDKTHESEEGIEIRWSPNDADNTQVTKVLQWTVPDLANFHRFNLHINATDYDYDTGAEHKANLKGANFTEPVKVPILDQTTGKSWMVTLEPRELIIHVGTAGSGHYFMYGKQDDDAWVRHDDRQVVECPGLRSGEQAKMISFAVVGKEPIPDTSALNAKPERVAVEPQENAGGSHWNPLRR